MLTFAESFQRQGLLVLGTVSSMSFSSDADEPADERSLMEHEDDFNEGSCVDVNDIPADTLSSSPHSLGSWGDDKGSYRTAHIVWDLPRDDLRSRTMSPNRCAPDLPPDDLGVKKISLEHDTITTSSESFTLEPFTEIEENTITDNTTNASNDWKDEGKFLIHLLAQEQEIYSMAAKGEKEDSVSVGKSEDSIIFTMIDDLNKEYEESKASDTIVEDAADAASTALVNDNNEKNNKEEVVKIAAGEANPQEIAISAMLYLNHEQENDLAVIAEKKLGRRKLEESAFSTSDEVNENEEFDSSVLTENESKDIVLEGTRRNAESSAAKIDDILDVLDELKDVNEEPLDSFLPGFAVKVEIRPTPHLGENQYGVFAAQDIPAQHVIWHWTDSLKTFHNGEIEAHIRATYDEDIESIQTFLRRGFVLKAPSHDFWISGKDDSIGFLNCSSSPNCRHRRAIRDIQKGEELTLDYTFYGNPQWYVDICHNAGIMTAYEVAERQETLGEDRYLPAFFEQRDIVETNAWLPHYLAQIDT